MSGVLENKNRKPGAPGQTPRNQEFTHGIQQTHLLCYPRCDLDQFRTQAFPSLPSGLLASLWCTVLFRVYFMALGKNGNWLQSASTVVLSPPRPLVSSSPLTSMSSAITSSLESFIRSLGR